MAQAKSNIKLKNYENSYKIEALKKATYIL